MRKNPPAAEAHTEIFRHNNVVAAAAYRLKLKVHFIFGAYRLNKLLRKLFYNLHFAFRRAYIALAVPAALLFNYALKPLYFTLRVFVIALLRFFVYLALNGICAVISVKRP